MPELKYCGDNAAMIGSQGYYEFISGVEADESLNAYATMPIDEAYKSGNWQKIHIKWLIWFYVIVTF